MNKKSEVHLMISNKINGKQTIRTENGVAHLLATYFEFKDIRINKYNNYFTYMNKEYEVYIKNNVENLEKEVVFTLVLKCSKGEEEIEEIEKVVNILISILKKYFNNIYIIKSDIAATLCKSSYQYIYDAENTLREFIMKFMISKIGSEWWTYNITDSNINKANERKDDSFNQLLNEDIYNIDFKDLAEIIFKNPSKYKTKSDVLNELNQCKTLEDFKKLKENAISNWDRYFSEYFDENWSSKWNELAKYRNKIAHNKLISTEMVNNIKKLSKEVIENIEKATNKIDQFRYSQQEVFSIENEKIVIRNYRQQAEINKLKQLGIELDSINEEIKNLRKGTEESFSSADIIRKFNNGRYSTNDSMNRSIGYILSSMSKYFKIKQTGESINVEDDDGNKTTCKEYTFIEEETT